MEPMQPVKNNALSARSIRALNAIGAVALALTIALTFSQVVLRYVFNNPQAWSEEISRYLFIWITAIGIASAYYNDTNIKIDLLAGMGGKGMEKVVGLFRYACDMLAVLTIGYSGFIVMMNKYGAKFFTVPYLPQTLFHVAIPLCFAFSFLYIAIIIKNILSK